MTINENLIKFFFNKKQFLKLLSGMVIIIVMTSICFLVISVHTIEKNYKVYKNTLEKAYIPDHMKEYDKLYAKCRLINCQYIIINKGEYFLIPDSLNKQLQRNNYLDRDYFESINYNWLNNNLTNAYDIMIDEDNPLYNVTYVVDNGGYLLAMVDGVIFVLVIFCLVFFVLFIYIQYINYKNDLYEKGSYRLYTKNKLQTAMTDMLNHELNAPLAILKTVSIRVHELITSPEMCNDVPTEDIAELLDSFDFGIESLDSIVRLLSIGKKMKHNKNNHVLSVHELLNYSVSNTNNIHVIDLKPLYLNDKDLQEYALGKKLAIGDFLNIMHVLLVNSREAGATTITFNCRVKNNKMELFVKDNGSGVRNSNGDFLKNNTIFTWGYSSKDKDGRHITNTKWYVKILGLFNISIIKTDTSRGIGLYVNKMLLRRSDGDIELDDTGPTGTTFKLILPVSKLQKKK